MAKPTAIFAALSDPTRRTILESLGSKGQTAGSIASQFNISWPGISRHLRILKAAGLIWETREGRSRYYEINHQALLPVLTWLGQFRPDVPSPSTPPVAAASLVGREYTS
jgi:DNA-binding transcriptional ArsR family regulator